MLVSVIIPVYNRRDLLAKCLESVTAQRYDDWEVVVVDDGSTEDVATDLDPGDSRIRYVRQENAGPSVARNRGVENARGEALLFLDSDDVLLPDALSVLVEGLAAHPAAEVAYGWFYLMTSEEEPRAMACLSEQPAAPSASPWSDADASAYGLRAQGNPTAALLQDDALVMGSALLRRPAVERIGGFDPSVEYMEHWDFYLRLAAADASFFCVEAPVMVIRSHENNRGSSNLHEMLRMRLAGIEEYGAALPADEAEAVRTSARARAYVRAAIGHCAHGDFADGFECLSRALSARPLVADEEALIVQLTMAAAFEQERPADWLDDCCRALRTGREQIQMRRRLLATVHRRLGRQALSRRQGRALLAHLALATYYQPFFVASKLRSLLWLA